MAELLGGALLSGFLNALFERMASKEVIKLFQGKKTIPKLLKELKIKLISANELLNDAEEKQMRNHNVNKWLEELKDVIYEADRVVDKINTEALRRRVEEEEKSDLFELKSTKCLSFIPMQFSLFDRVVKVELGEILANLKLLLEQSTHLGLKQGNQRSPWVARSLAPLVEESNVFGRENEKKAIIKLLLSDDVRKPKISVIPIVGMGGIGKTTLAQVVYNNARVQEHFDLKAWVTVSEVFDVPKLTKAIFESITRKKCEFEDPFRLQSELKAALRGKKFLFVHDDVWNEEYELWDLLKSSFELGAHGSKIIVTTCSEIVALQMGNVESYYLERISKDDCWELFAKHVFENVNSDAHSDLKKIGIEIVEKCKGLPLAVKSMAGLLRSMMSPESWRRILESEIWELELREINNTKILPALWLSYFFLPPHLKQCFAFLSIFPKDYEFRVEDREKIILMWMAEGLLPLQINRRVEDLGEEYLNILISRSFFQRLPGYRYKFEQVLVMHDLMHDLALLVSGGLHSNSSKIHHFPFRETREDMIKLENLLLGSPRLRGLFALPTPKYLSKSKLKQTVLSEVLVKGGCLRLLSLLCTSIRELPYSAISGQKHLRYLDLSRTKIENLPSSVCTLYNLQTLLLANCQNLRQLPSNMSHLINLRHLNIQRTPLNEMPPHMCNLKDLQVLSGYVVGERNRSGIKDLAELQHLRGHFRITGLQNIKTVSDVLGAMMKNKRYLDKLHLEWDKRDSLEDLEKETEILNALEPHSRLLKEVTIVGFGGLEFPSWVAKQSFREMVKVSLIDCKTCCLLPPFGQLPLLKELEIERMVGMVSIGDEICGTSELIFPSLEKLTLKKMPSWDKWSFNRVDEQEGFVLFPCLKELKLISCSKVSIGLPVGHFPALEQIYISRFKSMVSVFPITYSYGELVDTALYPSLQFIRIYNCKLAQLFQGRGLFPSTLKELRVDHCTRLMSNRHDWGLQRLSSLQMLTLSGDHDCHTFPEEGLLLPTSLIYLRIEDFKTMKFLNGKALQQLTSLLQGLHVHGCQQLKCLPDEGLPLSLTSLRIRKNHPF